MCIHDLFALAWEEHSSHVGFLLLPKNVFHIAKLTEGLVPIFRFLELSVCLFDISLLESTTSHSDAQAQICCTELKEVVHLCFQYFHLSQLQLIQILLLLLLSQSSGPVPVPRLKELFFHFFLGCPIH